MPTFHTFIAFALVSLGLALIPGPSTFFLMSQGALHGRSRALASVAGIEIASAVRVLATAAGLSALLASSAVAFSTIRWVGVAYLAYLGLRAMTAGHRAKASESDPASPDAGSSHQSVAQGRAGWAWQRQDGHLLPCVLPAVRACRSRLRGHADPHLGSGLLDHRARGRPAVRPGLSNDRRVGSHPPAPEVRTGPDRGGQLPRTRWLDRDQRLSQPDAKQRPPSAAGHDPVRRRSGAAIRRLLSGRI